jgi:hypothetical protein
VLGERHKQGIEIRLVSMHERGNVIFVEPYTHKIALSVQGGKGIEFEEQQALHSRTRDVPLAEGVHRCILTLAERGFSGTVWTDPPGQVWANFIHEVL